MKTAMLMMVAFVLSTGVAFAQGFPVTGKWRLQVIGTPEEFSIEINSSTWTFEINGSTVPQIVTIDNSRKTIIIPLLTGLAEYYFFEIKDNYIDLKAGGRFNVPLLDAMRGGMAGMAGINDVTDDFVNNMLIEMEAAFYRVPIMRLYHQ